MKRLLNGVFLSEEEILAVGFKYVGKGVKIHSNACIYCPENVSIGDFSRIDDFAVIIATGEVQIGHHAHIANFCYLGGKHGIRLEDYVGLSPRVSIFSASDDYSGKYMTNPTVPDTFLGTVGGLVHLSPHCIVGAHSVLLPNSKLLEGAAVGAMSLVKGTLAEWSIYSGVPAKRIKDRDRAILHLADKFEGSE
jgi:acetyltransferase-like isoleucine patch superfamily enzyme